MGSSVWGLDVVESYRENWATDVFSILKHYVNTVAYNILFFLNVRNTRRVKKETRAVTIYVHKICKN